MKSNKENYLEGYHQLSEENIYEIGPAVCQLPRYFLRRHSEKSDEKSRQKFIL